MKKWFFFFAVTISLIYFFPFKNEPLTLEYNTKILAFGDSLTYGIGADKNSSYPAILSKRLHVNVENYGIPGEISADGLKRLQAVLDKTNPNILLLCHGGNDILKKYDLKKTKENLKKMIQIAQNQSIRVILIGVPSWQGILGIRTEKIYDEIAKETKVEYQRDIIEIIENDVQLKSDRVHPNAKGYEKMAKAIEKVILQK